MGTILDRDYISCCTREDVDDIPQPPYTHQCGCPQATPICNSEEKTATLCGYREFLDFVSSPPKKFTKLKVTGRGIVITKYQEPFPCAGKISFTETYSGISTREYDLSVCVEQNYQGDIIYTQQGTTCNVFTNETTETEPEQEVLNLPPWDGDQNISNPNLFNVSANGYTLNHFSRDLFLDYEIDSEDTEEDALDRATPSAGTFCSSLYELRTNDFDFIVRTSSYAIKASNLMVGAHYKAIVLIERRPAIKNPDGSGYIDSEGNPSEWTTEDDEGAEMVDEYIFGATAIEQIVPTTGTWSDDNTDEVIDDSEVTPLIELPNIQGWEYRIADGYPKIQLALTSEIP